jgi:hypothetical protein
VAESVNAPKEAAPGAPQPKVDANGRAHAPEDGKFLPGATEPAAEGTTEATTPEASTDAVLPDGWVMLEVPESNPLYARRKTIPVPEKDADTFRGVLSQAANTTAQKEHLSRVISERDQAQREMARLQAVMQFEREHGGEFWTQEDQGLYNDIVASYSDALGEEGAKAAAEAFKRGRLAEAERAKHDVVTEADKAIEAESVRGQAQLFTQLAVADATKSFPAWSEAEVRGVLQSYGAWLGVRARSGQPVAFDLNDPQTAVEWKKFAATQYALHPAVQKQRQDADARLADQRAEERARDRETERLRAAAQSRATNPLGGVAGTQTTLTTPGDRPMTVPELLSHYDRKAKGIK